VLVELDSNQIEVLDVHNPGLTHLFLLNFFRIEYFSKSTHGVPPIFTVLFHTFSGLTLPKTKFQKPQNPREMFRKLTFSIITHFFASDFFFVELSLLSGLPTKMTLRRSQFIRLFYSVSSIQQHLNLHDFFGNAVMNFPKLQTMRKDGSDRFEQQHLRVLSYNQISHHFPLFLAFLMIFRFHLN
jgi:hypothetical protein